VLAVNEQVCADRTIPIFGRVDLPKLGSYSKKEMSTLRHHHGHHHHHAESVLAAMSGMAK
jgi:hypothetical protein